MKNVNLRSIFMKSYQQYIVTKKIQTWDCSKYEIYKLNDRHTCYVSSTNSGYLTDQIDYLKKDSHWFFDDFSGATRKLALVEYNNKSYCELLRRAPAFFAIDEPRSGSFQCECGTHLILREYGETTNDDGIPLDDGVVIRGVCLCAKVHSFQRKVEVEITVKYEKKS